MIIKKVSSKVKRVVSKISNDISMRFNWFDMSSNIETGVYVDKEDLYDSIDSPNIQHMNRYGPTNIKQLNKSFRQLLSIDKTLLDSGLIDIGCGKGRVLIMAEKLGFKSVIGVEFSKKLCDICEENLKKIKSKVSRVICADATNYEFSGDIRTFYFYNPFEYILLEKVLKNIKEYLKSKDHAAYVVYIDPRKFGRLDSKEYELLINDESAINPFHIYKVLR